MPEFSSESVAFVTGAASGIGLATAQRLVSDGITKIALVDLTEDRLSEAHASISSLSPSAQILNIGADCSDEEAIESAILKTVEAFGRIDFALNAAGVSGGAGKTTDRKTENYDFVVGVNLRGLWLCERAEIKQMLKQELRNVSTGLPVKTRGSILNVGSLTSHCAIPQLSPYIMAKHGVLGLTRADAVDYALEGIRVNAICPGWIKTAITEQLWNGPRGETVVARAPMQRWGLPEEVAYTCSFLLSDKASFITGTSVDIDGGYGAC